MSEESAIERLKRAVIARTGHHYYSDKDKLLYERSRERMRALGVATLEAYVDVLERGDGEEWRRLEDVITIGETYFFRYPEHFVALREDVLPRLIDARRSERALRIWSIGCSNGAEPYSVAILLRELLGSQIDSWRIAIIGGDISEKALSAARIARFNNWSLRAMPLDERGRYFDVDGASYVLKREYRTMVRFERQNILELLLPAAPIEWDGFDLILCRNVLIYFSPGQAIEIVDALAKRVAADGALFLGHAEAALTSNPYFRTAPTAGLPTEFAQALHPPIAPPAYFPPVVPLLPLSMLARPPLSQPDHGSHIDLAARMQQLADAGAYEEAERLCAELLKSNPTSPRWHYYDAILRQVTDDLAGAEAALRRALYLDRSFVVAHHRLGVLLLAVGRHAEARRSLQIAAQLAEAAEPCMVLPDGDGVSAKELRDAARLLIASLGEAA